MEGQEKSSKTKRAIVLTLCVVTLVFACIMGTYAYFIINVNNDNRQNAQIDTGTMRLTFAEWKIHLETKAPNLNAYKRNVMVKFLI